MRYARLIVGAALVLSPFACGAQEASSGSTVATSDSGTLLLARLDAVAEGALEWTSVGASSTAMDSWNAERTRYAERAAELRGRCRDEIRKANRDTIVGLSGQCLRGDLMLEIAHRRKERDLFAGTRGIDPAVGAAAQTAIDAWIDAAQAVIDGVDANVFATVDTVLQAKRNLHETYRAPMFASFARVRSSLLLSVTRSLAASVRTALDGEPRDMLGAFVPCVEQARDALAAGQASTGTAADLRAGIAELRACVTLAKDAAE